MTEIRFYHLQRQPVEQVLPGLLSKALDQKRRVVVKIPDATMLEKLNAYLWTYDPNSFLPHGSAKDGHAERQPVWLTLENEAPNHADMLIVLSHTETPDPSPFALCCEFVDGHDEDDVARARARWKDYKARGFDITYWQQGDKGWEKKA